MLTKQNYKIVRYLLLFFIGIIFAIVQITPSVEAAAKDKFLDVDRENTVFYDYADKDVIVAVRDNKVAVFGKEPGFKNRWKQKTDLYNKGGLDCGAHIQYNNTNEDRLAANEYTLYEREKNGCSSDDYHQGGIELIEPDESVTKAAQNINWGNEPLGCPNFGNIPNNANKKDLNYNCPDGGAVIKGVYDKNEKIDTPRLASANASACGDVAGAFGWLICEPAEKIGDFTMWFEKQLYTLLHINELPLAADGGVYQAWASIRTVATTVLVLVALVAIASQIFNFDFISAYTIKKIIPKIVIATILIFTSYYLAAMGIAFVNALGDGINALILAPFPDLMDAYNQNETISFVLSNISGIGGGEAGVAGGIIVGAGIAAIGGAGLFGLLIPIILVIGAVVVAFITLVLRKVFILALVLIMPLAIVAWILPGTQKWFDSWWKLFSKLLLMYPLVIGLLAVGKVAAYLIATGTESVTAAALPQAWNVLAVNGQASIVILMVLIAYFGPYYFIPSMFKTAGGVFGKITSGMQSFGSKYARKGGEASNQWAKGYASNKLYDPSRNRYSLRNKAARLATGNILPTKQSAARTAQTGAKFRKEREESAAFLVSEATRQMEYTQGNNWLQNQLSSKNNETAQAAFDNLVRRGEIGEISNFLNKDGNQKYRPNNSNWLQEKIEAGGHGGAFLNARPDLIKGGYTVTTETGDYAYDPETGLPKGALSSMSVRQLAQADKTFWMGDGATEIRDRAHNDPDFLRTIQSLRDNEQVYNDLKPVARDVVDSLVGPSRGARRSSTGGPSTGGPSTGGNSGPSSGGGGGSGGGGNSGPSSGGGGGSGQSAPAGPGYVAPMPPPTPGTAYTGLTPPAAPAKVVLDETSIRELANNVRESGGKGLSKEDRRDISQETAERIENIERTRNDDGPPV
ncbi:MAG: hypothetical protein R3B12_00090 [Candidatus Saccharimonadales bacterium]